MRDESLTPNEDLDEDLLVSDKDAAPVGLQYPFDEIPEIGTLKEVADGIWWLRMPLPFALDHINLWLLRDGDGFAIVDTGIALGQVKEIWRNILSEFVADKAITKIIVTHYHPDHIGLAGWLNKKTGAPILCTRTEYLYSRMLSLDIRDEPPVEAMDFYKAAGFDAEQLETVRRRGWGGYAKGVSPLPSAYQRIVNDEILTIDGRVWQVIIGRGHAPEHACLFCAELGVFIAGDQLLPRISSNVSVYPTEPEANPLHEWLESLFRLKELPKDILVLPAHNEPFTGIDIRLNQLINGHCAKLYRLFRNLEKPVTTVGTLNTLFGRKFDEPMLLSMATGESLAHLRMLEFMDLVGRERREGVDHYSRLLDTSMKRTDMETRVYALCDLRD